MNNANNVRQYDLFKLVVAILLFLIFLLMFLWTRNQTPAPQQADATPLPTLTSVPATQTSSPPTTTSSPVPSPTETHASEPTATPTNVPAPTATNTPASSSADGETSVEISTCEEIAKSQLQVGITAIIKQRLNFRSSPSIQNNRILTHKPDSQVEVVGGPTCTRYENGGAYLWWQLKHANGLVGWSAEASIFGDYYFMEPAE